MKLSELIFKKKSPEILKTLQKTHTHVRGLQEEVGGSQSTIQSRISQMEKEELIKKEREDKFPYKKILKLTEKGKKVTNILNTFEGIERKRKIKTIEFEEEKEKMKWPLAILQEWGEQGNTKMQKIIFLLKKELGVEIPYDFNPYKHGPFCKELARDMGKLMTLGLVDPVESSYSLTSEGEELAGELLEDLDDSEEQALEKLEKYDKMGLRRLMNYVYDLYPEESGSPMPQ